MRALNRHSLLLAPLEADDSLTLQQQLYQRLRQAILNGQLAAELQVLRNTVIAVWSQLQAEGFILSDRQASRVSRLAHMPLLAQASDDSADWPVSARAARLHSLHRLSSQELALRPSTPALAQWRRALNQTSQQAQLLGYGDPLGELALREALARGVRSIKPRSRHSCWATAIRWVSWRCVRRWRAACAVRRSRL